ncbi:MAG: flagellar filament capping protein FliD [Halieaceae bacterium]|nr:flagellar filament capping protein FliD [Halieaceae bacterium]
MNEVNSIGSKILTGLGNGSGIDIYQLATDLTDVERLPKQDSLNSAKAASEAAISAYSVLSFQIGQLRNAFANLNDAAELTSASGSSSQSSNISVTTATGAALSGSHEISVSQLAYSQRNVSNAFASSTTSLNGGAAFDITLTVGNASTSTQTIGVAAGDDTPVGIVNTINRAGLGFNATLVDTAGDGSSYKIILEGPSGAEGQFSVSSASSTSLGFGDETTALRTAQDAIFEVDGVEVNRASNTIDDVLTGVTFELKNTIDAGSPATLSISKDTDTLKTTLQTLVAAYNDLNYSINELGNPDSLEDEVGGALSGDGNLLRTVKNAVREAVQGDSSTPSGGLNALRDIGITIDRFGDLQFDEATYDTLAQSNFDDISTMLSAGTTNQSFYDGQAQGLARDVMASLDELTASSGIINSRKTSAAERVSDYDDELEKLEMRMEMVYNRYIQQFGVMESMVATLNSTRDYLEGQLEALSANFSNK